MKKESSVGQLKLNISVGQDAHWSASYFTRFWAACHVKIELNGFTNKFPPPEKGSILKRARGTGIGAELMGEC